jgi:uncharacterized membrane protein (Fun14 family)
MGYAALGLTMVGLAAGFTSRLKVLLLLVGAVFLLSIGFSLQSGFTFVWTAAIVMIAQTILQSCYVAGLVVRSVLHPAQFSELESEAEPSDAAGEPSAKAFGKTSKTRRLQRLFAQGTVRGQLPSRQP